MFLSFFIIILKYLPITLKKDKIKLSFFWGFSVKKINSFSTEREGQIDFYKQFLPRINPDLDIDEILSDYNDGILNGNLLEFKLNVKDLNEVLFQTIKYLSSLRLKGKPVPAGIHIIDSNNQIDWYYKSAPYLNAIEKVYTGGASKDNSGFIGNKPDEVLHFGSNDLDAERLIELLKEDNFIKIHIDENCIVGWANSFYKEVPTARKEDFIGDYTGHHKTVGEIRKPKYFKDYIYPYEGESNVKFNYLMDKLNDTIQKKNLGAFYTPTLYAEKAHELLREAIKRVPEGNDYIILDRCAGTGNLEIGLTDEELSHCIVSTYEYYEYKVLQELIGSKVRHIIPPFETNDTFNAGLVNGADALSKEYLENEIIQQYIQDPNCTIILFENPPYAETTSIEHQKRKIGGKSSKWKNSYIVQEMKKEVKGLATNDLGNAFIWSGFNYYLRQPTDSYIVFSPPKYWKAQHLINKKFLDGYGFNRRHFHTNIDAFIMCVLWSNEDQHIESFEVEGFDLEEDHLNEYGLISIERIHDLYSKRYYDRRPFKNSTFDGILTGKDGLLAKDSVKKTQKPIYSPEMLGYLVVSGSGFDNPDNMSNILVAGLYNGHGFYLHKDNYLDKLPTFVASRYITYNRQWTERARIMKSADGADKYFRDLKDGKLDQFLLKCLLFTTLETQNHMRSLTGSDGRFYRNELCLDDSNGETIALRDLKNLKVGVKEEALLKQWNEVLYWAKRTDEYDSSLTYGIYQIIKDLNTYYKDEKTGKKVWNYVELNSAIRALKTLVKDYYNTEIVPTLFEYEFLK